MSEAFWVFRTFGLEALWGLELKGPGDLKGKVTNKRINYNKGLGFRV